MAFQAELKWLVLGSLAQLKVEYSRMAEVLGFRYLSSLALFCICLFIIRDCAFLRGYFGVSLGFFR